MKVDINKISFQEYLKIRKQLYENAAEIRDNENNIACYNVPYQGEYSVRYVTDNIFAGHINEGNFQEQWHCQREVNQWNEEPYGKDYPKLLRQYQKLASSPKTLKLLKELWEKGGRSWGYVWKQTAKANEENRFLTFWQYTLAYNDTRGAWRHWWDALQNDVKFKVGDIAELRTRATRNNVFFEYTHSRDASYRYLRNIYGGDFVKISKQPLMIVGYDQKSPEKTYSYKKASGSHRLVTVLPVGSSNLYYIPEQFLKISRRKSVKDAKKV